MPIVLFAVGGVLMVTAIVLSLVANSRVQLEPAHRGRWTALVTVISIAGAIPCFIAMKSVTDAFFEKKRAEALQIRQKSEQELN